MLAGIIGSILGFLGGAVGTYFSIKNTNGPRERSFMIRAAIITWVGLGLVAATFFLLPEAKIWVWLSCFAVLPFAIVYCNRRQESIRREEGS